MDLLSAGKRVSSSMTLGQGHVAHDLSKGCSQLSSSVHFRSPAASSALTNQEVSRSVKSDKT